MSLPGETARFSIVGQRWRRWPKWPRPKWPRPGWSRLGWSRLGWAAAHALLGLHLLGSFLPACSVPPSPTIARDAYGALRFYPQALHLDHGYHFFGPDPGQTTTLRFVALRPDGQRIRGTYPDKRMVPRLRYHRHFMLTESLPRLLDSDAALGQLQLDSYAQTILRLHQAQSLELYRVTRRLPTVHAFLAGLRLDDETLVQEQHLGSFQAAF